MLAAAPTGEVGQDSVVQSITVIRGDANTIAQTNKAAFQAMSDLMSMMPQDAGASMNSSATNQDRTVSLTSAIPPSSPPPPSPTTTRTSNEQRRRSEDLGTTKKMASDQV